MTIDILVPYIRRTVVQDDVHHVTYQLPRSYWDQSTGKYNTATVEVVGALIRIGQPTYAEPPVAKPTGDYVVLNYLEFRNLAINILAHDGYTIVNENGDTVQAYVNQIPNSKWEENT